MGKVCLEICMVSARGLRRTSALWKLQWFGVGWINPDNKYCTRVDASGNANPVWKTKFSALIDSSDPTLSDLALHVEVYSREPIFLRERLQGTATVVLKEFLDKYSKNPKPVEEVGSFQLRRRNSNKPQGFVDVSIHIYEEKELSSYPGEEEGLKLGDHNSGINLVRGPDYGHPVPFSTSYPNVAVAGPSRYPPPLPEPSYSSVGGHGYQTHALPGSNYQPPPPPPPRNVGYKSTSLPPSYINMPSSSSGPSNGPGFGMGMGAGALAAGAVIFGDNFMSGFDLPAGLKDASLTISTNPTF